MYVTHTGLSDGISDSEVMSIFLPTSRKVPIRSVCLINFSYATYPFRASARLILKKRSALIFKQGQIAHCQSSGLLPPPIS